MRKNTLAQGMLIIFSILTMLPFASSNGGCTKFADDTFVQLSMAPLAPIAGEKVSFVISVANESRELVNGEMRGNFSVSRDGKRTVIREFATTEGVFDAKHAFEKPGLYELFVEFTLNGKEYAPEDFLIEVTEAGTGQGIILRTMFLALGIVIGIAIMGLMRSWKR
jgi:hypothetical protein